MDLKVKIVRPGVNLPSRAHETDAGVDLSFAEDVFFQDLEANPTKLFPSGIAVEIPVGYVGLVFPRSSTYKRWGITLSNSVGVIDSDFRGEISFSLIIARQIHAIYIPKNVKIAQLVVVPIALLPVVEVAELSQTERGTGGYGSTGQ